MRNTDYCFSQFILWSLGYYRFCSSRFRNLCRKQILFRRVWLLPPSCIMRTFWSLWNIGLIFSSPFLYRSCNFELLLLLVLLCFHWFDSNPCKFYNFDFIIWFYKNQYFYILHIRLAKLKVLTNSLKKSKSILKNHFFCLFFCSKFLP